MLEREMDGWEGGRKEDRYHHQNHTSASMHQRDLAEFLMVKVAMFRALSIFLSYKLQMGRLTFREVTLS